MSYGSGDDEDYGTRGQCNVSAECLFDTDCELYGSCIVLMRTALPDQADVDTANYLDFDYGNDGDPI